MAPRRTPGPASDPCGFEAALERTGDAVVDHRLMKIERILAPHERVLLALPGMASDNPSVLLATTTRLVRVDTGWFRLKVARQAPAAHVLGATYRPGVLTRVHVGIRGDRGIVLSPSSKAAGERFAVDLEHLVRAGRLD